PLVVARLRMAQYAARLPRGAVQHSRDVRMGGPRPELREHLLQSPLAGARRANHGREIAAEVARVTNVEHDHLVDVLSPLPLLIEHQRRNADAFMEDLGGASVIGSVRSASNIALM